jgi:hypothetical protein
MIRKKLFSRHTPLAREKVVINDCGSEHDYDHKHEREHEHDDDDNDNESLFVNFNLNSSINILA